LRAYYFLYLSDGQRRFGREAEAEASLAEGMAFAAKSQLHQIAHEASVAIEALRSREATHRDAVTSQSAVQQSIRWIALELSSMREAATTSSS
jgi:hypothetical protein